MNGDDRRFTIVLPIRDTDAEYQYMKRSLPSALKLNPSELIVCLDKPASQRLIERINEIVKANNYADSLIILEIERSAEWNFPLAHIIWEAYCKASYDCILSFDVDSILMRNVLRGLEFVGKDDIAMVSFTKRLRIRSIQELVRYLLNRTWVNLAGYTFAGVYWVYRPFFFDTISIDKYKSIYNGIDILLEQEIMRLQKYKIMTRREIGVIALTPQNNDMPWRQFQMGVWFAANESRWKEVRKRSLTKLNKVSFATNDGKDCNSIIKLLRRWYKDKVLGWTEDHPTAFVIISAIMKMHPYMLQGYFWGKKHPTEESVKVASTMDLEEWNYLGSKYFTNRNWKTKGTGYVDA